MILTENPDIEVVQIQFNYVDYEDPALQSKACYEVCRKHNKPIIVMEPVKGGNLVNLPEEAKRIYEDLGDMAQMQDNLSFMKDFQLLSSKVKTLFHVQLVVTVWKNVQRTLLFQIYLPA